MKVVAEILTISLVISCVFFFLVLATRVIRLLRISYRVCEILFHNALIFYAPSCRFLFLDADQHQPDRNSELAVCAGMVLQP
jgi:hypothetical protein